MIIPRMMATASPLFLLKARPGNYSRIVCLIILGCFSHFSVYAQETLVENSATASQTALPVIAIEEVLISVPPAALGLDSFYRKYADAYGIPVVSSEKVPNTALLMARDILNYMLLKRADIREELIRRKARVSIMAATEMETDLPERSDWKKPAIDHRRLTPGERRQNIEVRGSHLGLVANELFAAARL